MAEAYCKWCGCIRDGMSRSPSFQCKTCGRYTPKSQQEELSKELPTDDKFSYKSDGHKLEYVVTSDKLITTEEEAIKACKLDRNEWKMKEISFGGSQGYRKDKTVDWIVDGGKVTSGEVHDSGKMIVVQLHSYRITWIRKTEEIRTKLLVTDLIENAKKFAPKYPKIKYDKITEPHLLEIALPDLQLGRLVDENATRDELNPELQVKIAEEAIDRLISYSKDFPVAKILFPVGNDFFDSNTAEMMTAHGTPQSDDVRWQKTYDLGCQLLRRIIDKLMLIAPVEVLVIPGNHDEERIFYLGSWLDAWYHNSQDVTVDNRPVKRKYFDFGSNLIMLTHGYYEKTGKLDSLMAYEEPDAWARCKNREIHLGDKHHKVDMVMKTHELENGVVVRILRSLASPSVWEHDKGFVGSLKSAEAFLWHVNDGVVAQFTARK